MSSGTWTMSNAGSGCLILSQLANVTETGTITAMVPVCASAGAVTVSWPFSTDGDGDASSLLIYGDVAEDSTGASAGCVVALSEMQVMYILGRTLTWETDGTIYDSTAGGYLSDSSTYATITCGADDTYLPSGFNLPDPYYYSSTASVWDETITIEANGGAAAETVDDAGTTSLDATTAVVETAATLTSATPTTATPTAAAPTSATSTTVVTSPAVTVAATAAEPDVAPDTTITSANRLGSAGDNDGPGGYVVAIQQLERRI
ncbi:hypothetical protein Q5752_000874 [Cryptotrichosporon argae]